MSASVGDRIVVEAKTATTSERAGRIEEILEGERPRYVVRWDDGRTSILSPSAGSARVQPARGRSRGKGNGGTTAAKRGSGKRA